MRYFIILFGLILLISYSGCKGNNSHEPQKVASNNNAVRAAQPHSKVIEGKVLEVLNVPGYTYLNLNTGNEKIWVAIPESKVEKESIVKVLPDMELRNFTSRALNRTFERIIFATGIVGDHHNNHSKASINPHAAMPSSLTKKAESLEIPKGFQLDKAQGENGFTVAEIYQKRKELNRKTVRVNGFVTKVLSGIMGKNWVHLQDGTGGKDGTPTELVVTTNALPNPGDVIAVEGTLYADKDFGAGYKYDVIIENSKVETLTSKKEKN